MLINMKGGFTLIEVLVAAFIITVGAGGAFALVQQGITFTTVAASQLKASFLAQEGAEIARGIRDTNLLKIHKGQTIEWTEGLTGCGAGCGADYEDVSLSPGTRDQFLKIGTGNLYYTYGTGNDTPYKRSITVIPEGNDALHVLVEVTWEERGRSHEVKAATELYNWLPVVPPDND